jgi:hypothetical protein
MINADNPRLWKKDIADSVDFYNRWFMKFAPATYRETRIAVTKLVEDALRQSNDLSQITPEILRKHPAILPTFRMCCCPPLARERLAGLTGVKKTLIEKMEAGAIPSRMTQSVLGDSLSRIVQVLSELLDLDLFPWLAAKQLPDQTQRHRLQPSSRIACAVRCPTRSSAMPRKSGNWRLSAAFC